MRRNDRASTLVRVRFFDRAWPAWVILGGMLAIGCMVAQYAMNSVNVSDEAVHVTVAGGSICEVQATLAPRSTMRLQDSRSPFDTVFARCGSADSWTEQVFPLKSRGHRTVDLWIDVANGQPYFADHLYEDEWKRTSERLFENAPKKPEVDPSDP